MSKYAVIYEQAADGGWSAMIPDLENVWSLGRSIPQARANVLDAVADWIAYCQETDRPFPKRVYKVGEVDIALPRRKVARAAVKGRKGRAT